ncbi:hypothetical protein BJX65DRAFT_170548 [Aspergillus insuetus]
MFSCVPTALSAAIIRQSFTSTALLVTPNNKPRISRVCPPGERGSQHWHGSRSSNTTGPYFAHTQLREQFLIPSKLGVSPRFRCASSST